MLVLAGLSGGIWFPAPAACAQGAGPAPAQADAGQSLPASNAAAVAAALRALPNQRGLAADARKQADELLQQAQADETHADDLAQQWQRLNQTAASADAEAQKLEQAALAADPTATLVTWKAALPTRATAEQLEALLARERDAAANARAAVAAAQDELARQTMRPAQLRDELAAANVALAANAATPAPADLPAALAHARSLRAQAARRLANVQIALLNLENRSYEPRMRLLSAQLRAQQRAASDAAQRVAALENLLLDRTGARVKALQDQVTADRNGLDSRAQTLIAAADANIALVDRLSGVVADTRDLRTRKQAWDRAMADTSQALKNTEDRIRIGGVDEAVGLILLAEKRKLQPLAQIKRQLDELQTRYAQTRLGLIDVREQQNALGDLDAATTAALARLPDLPPERMKVVRETMYRLLATRAQILVQLNALQTRLAGVQGDAEPELRALVATTARLDAILDVRLLWTPSHTPVDGNWFANLFSDRSGFLSGSRWRRTLRDAGTAIAEAPLLAALGVLVLVSLLALRRRAVAQLAAIATPLRRIRSDRYRHTGMALVWTVLAAVPLPFALWLIGQALRAAPGNAAALETGSALVRLVPDVFVLAFLGALTWENGLAQFHFRWPRPRRAALSAATPWLGLAILPAQFLVGLMLLRADAAATDEYGRALLVAALLGMAVILGWLLAPGRLWTARYTELAEPLRLRQWLRAVLVGGLLALAVLVLRGYFVTAMTLSLRVLQSLIALLAANVVYNLAARWLVLGERRLALQRMEQRQQVDAVDAAADPGETPPEIQPEEITLASVNAQTRRLLRAVIAVAFAGALLWIWSDVAPALNLLGDVNVWTSSDQIDGKTVALSVSLRDALEAILVLALTWIATRNLPGLIELTLLRRLHVDAPTRYAITSLTRYAIVVTGTVAGLAMLGLHWSNLQWLAAGFSVGLGFGLQEIFANFVSGLMVLFERPFRIGDVVSIGDVEGTVARIRTRATTIVDWDNKEVIVPNKSFITERLTNWSLSNTTTRLVLRIGAAYASDPRQVRSLLLEIARAEALVADEPAPTCWFMQISACTFDFDLRVFVADIGERNRARDALYTRIAEVFRAKNIEMAFPQTDIWFRNAMPQK
ncbi:MAG: mechanosensitive ion channel [Proteobacteria bacterium]|nr:mechanosensitive ion channel [Pseudomonadota bacterium]